MRGDAFLFSSSCSFFDVPYDILEANKTLLPEGDNEEMFTRKRKATCQFIIPIYSTFDARRAISFALFVFIAKDQPRFLLGNAY
jgi:hypothetical protein